MNITLMFPFLAVVQFNYMFSLLHHVLFRFSIETHYFNTNYWIYSMLKEQARYGYFRTPSNLIISDIIYVYIQPQPDYNKIARLYPHMTNMWKNVIYNRIRPDTKYFVILDDQMEEAGSSETLKHCLTIKTKNTQNKS